MKINSLQMPDFFVDSFPAISGTDCRELLRYIDIDADPASIFAWLKQLRVAPYSYDFIDNRCIKSPDYLIANLPALRIGSHYLLAFHIFAFEENSFIVCRFCVPINPPASLYMNELLIEYRITGAGDRSRLWCKVKGYFNNGISSKGFFFIFSAVNKIMMAKQLSNLRKLSESLLQGKIETKIHDFSNYYAASGLHWWVFCRRDNCKGLIR